MREETVKVYKGNKNVTINKSDLELWNGNGYLTSSQQKSAADEKKAEQERLKKEAAEKDSGKEL